MSLRERRTAFRLLFLATELLVFSAILNQAGQDSEETGSRGNAGGPPSKGEEEEKLSPEAPAGLTFGGAPVRPGAARFVPEPGRIQSPFTVGILQANGHIVPVATLIGGSWSPLNPADLVQDWKRGGERFGKWTLWYENPGPSPEDPYRPDGWVDRLSPARLGITATDLVGSKTHCSSNLALATDAGDRRGSLIECDYCCPEPMRGIVTTSGPPPGLVERLDPEGEDSRRLTAKLLHTFNELENRAFKHRPYRLCYSANGDLTDMELLDENQRRKIPLRMRYAVRLREGESSLYNLTIIRDYPTSRGDSYPGYGLLGNWLRDTGDELEWVRQVFCLSPALPKPSPAEIEKAAGSPIPIVFWRRATGEIDILYRSTGWESEGYFVSTTRKGTSHESTIMSFR